MKFEWDRKKAVTNFTKHGVDFADAVGVFYDDLAITITDELLSEERFVTVGQDFLGRILVVVHCSRSENIRIISARPATRQELRQYEETS